MYLCPNGELYPDEEIYPSLGQLLDSEEWRLLKYRWDDLPLGERPYQRLYLPREGSGLRKRFLAVSSQVKPGEQPAVGDLSLSGHPVLIRNLDRQADHLLIRLLLLLVFWLLNG